MLEGGWVSVQSSRFLHVCELSPLSSWLWQDEQLKALVKQFGQQDWKFLASHFPVSAAPLLPAPPDREPGRDLVSGRRKNSLPGAPRALPTKQPSSLLRPFLPKLESGAP